VRVLQELRNRCGDAEFGYRVQALFAHIVMRLGWNVVEINAQGHPDIRARIRDHELLIQVKSVSHRTSGSMIELSSSDVAGIAALGRRSGWFVVLDCAPPVEWIVVTGSRAKWLLGKPIYLPMLRANSDALVSADCNEYFGEIVSANRARLPNLTYGVLRRRALSHNGL
jgi:hypothetical protein